jgi:hypothetical protein
MPPRPMRSLKMRLIWRMVLFVFSESLFVTSYTWSTTSCIAAPPPASRYSSSPVAEAAVRFGLGRRERDGRGDRSVGAWGGCWLAGRLQWWWWFCPTRVVSSDPGLALGTLTSGPSSTSFHFPLVSVAGGVARRTCWSQPRTSPAPGEPIQAWVGGLRRPRQGPQRNRRTRVRGDSASPAAHIVRHRPHAGL